MSPRSHPGADDATLLAALTASAGNGRSRGASRRARRQGAPAGGLLHWLPVVLALGMFAHVSLLGLRPALRESARLLVEEERLAARYEAELERQAGLDRILRAQRDPIYLERERRALLDPSSGLLAR